MTNEAPFPITGGNYKMPAEPPVRIGVVLAEDKMPHIEFELPEAGYALHAEGEQPHALETGKPLRVSASGDHVKMDGVGSAQSVLRVVPPAGAKLFAGAGALVRGVVAGRGFHWQKNIDQTLSGVLEFRARDGHLIMINELPIEEYMTGVITGEMSGECPIEYMKAQAVAARSWLLGQPKSPHPGEPFIWCNDDCCQRYQGTEAWTDRAIEAIEQCRGEVLITATNHYCDARYSKNTGGISEDATSVWRHPIEGLVARYDGPKDAPDKRFYPVTDANLEEYIAGDWLKDTTFYASPNAIPTDVIMKYLGRVDEGGHYFRWTVEVTQEELRESLTKRAKIEDIGAVHDIVCGPRGKSGRLEEITVVYTTPMGEKRSQRIGPEYYIRAALWTKFLYSSAILIDLEKNDDGSIHKATYRGAGWGHGAGLCQIGGLGRALAGQNYDEILMAYFSDVRLERIYD